jgi:hypothetical protein
LLNTAVSRYILHNQVFAGVRVGSLPVEQKMQQLSGKLQSAGTDLPTN